MVELVLGYYNYPTALDLGRPSYGTAVAPVYAFKVESEQPAGVI